MEPIRIGLVGAGGVAARHAAVLGGFPDVAVVAVADPADGRAAALADRYAAASFPGVQELLDEARPDAVYVCVPPHAHGDVESAVLGNGLPMFVEKPLAVDRTTAERVAELAAAKGVPVAVGHHWRYLDVLAQARELLADRPVRLVCGYWLDRVPPVPWWTRRDHSGGQVVEQVVHVLDLARLLAGEVTEVYAAGDGCPPEVAGADTDADVDGATAATLRFAGGTVGTVAATCRLGWKHRAGLEVYADRLALAITEDELCVRDGEKLTRVPADQQAAKVAVDRAFIDAVRTGDASGIRAPYADALATHRLACAVADSAQEKRLVRIADG